MSDHERPVGQIEVRYKVAPLFREGFGGISCHNDEAGAMAARDKLIRLGYPDVHVWKETIKRLA